MNPKRIIAVAVAVTALGAWELGAQGILGISLGGGFGSLTEDFTQGGTAKSLVYAGPGGYIDAELDFGRWYMDMGLSVFSSSNVTLGGVKQDTTGYETNLGIDFTAIGVGYLYPITDK